jgi:hypothetical protein
MIQENIRQISENSKTPLPDIPFNTQDLNLFKSIAASSAQQIETVIGVAGPAIRGSRSSCRVRKLKSISIGLGIDQDTANASEQRFCRKREGG